MFLLGIALLLIFFSFQIEVSYCYDGILERSTSVWEDRDEKDVIDQVVEKHIDTFLLTESELHSLVQVKSRPYCVKEALKDIIPECIKYGVDAIDSRLQKVTAMKLSICEFENSKVDFPSSCLNIDSESSFDGCIADIERAPQHWTTFSGYYRDITKICYEESLPFEKEQILSLYSNVTKIFSSLLRNFNGTYGSTVVMQNKIKLELDKILCDMRKGVLLQSQSIELVLNKKLDNFTKRSSEVFQGTWELSHNFSTETLHVFENIFLSMENLSKEVTKVSTGLSNADVDKVLEESRNAAVQNSHFLYEKYSSIFLEIIESLNIANTLSTEQQYAVGSVAHSLHKNQELSENLRLSLISIDEQVHQHYSSIMEELDTMMISFSRHNEEMISDVIKSTNNDLVDYASNLVSSLNLKFEETSLKLDEVISNIDSVSHRISNATSYFLDGVTLLTDNLFVGILSNVYNGIEYLGQWISNSFAIFGYGETFFFRILLTAVAIMLLLRVSLRKSYFNDILFKSASKENLHFNFKKNCNQMFKYITNIALLSSIIGGTIMAIVLTNFLIKLKLYVADTSTG